MQNVVTLEAIKSFINEEVGAELAKSVDALKGEIASLKKAVSAKTPVDKGIHQTRLLRAHIETMVKRANGISIKNNSVLDEVAEVIRKRYSDSDPSFVDAVSDRAKDLMATGNGGQLIVETYAQEFLDLMWNNTILDKVGVRFMPTSTGNLTIPKILSGVAAGYVGEGGTINTSSITFGKIKLSVKKLMALVPISNDLLRYTAVNVDAILRDQLLKQLAQVADYAVIYGKGGDYEPRGIANTAKIIKETGVQTTVATRAMGLKMVKELGIRNHSLDGLHWLMGWETYVHLIEERDDKVGYRNPEMASGTFLGHPFIVTNNIAKDATYEDLFLVKFSDLEAIQGMNVEIVASTEASIPVAGGQTLSAFAQDYTLVRAIVEHDFALAHGDSAVFYRPKLVA